MDSDLRGRFDRLLDEVLAELPDDLRARLEEVPLVVEDLPSRALLDELGVARGRDLCGLYTGVPLTERSVWQSGVLPDKLRIFRRGIVDAARSARGRLSDADLKRQIRITVLHEMGHHFGLDEGELRRLGYE
ncbi:MAG: metallopeptidase family protein [Planctomycetota bacterium]